MLTNHRLPANRSNGDEIFNRFCHKSLPPITRELEKLLLIVYLFVCLYLYSCKGFNNLNSFLAITIGLMNGAVTRLRQTWKEVPLKQRTRLEQFQALTVSSLGGDGLCNIDFSSERKAY